MFPRALLALALAAAAGRAAATPASLGARLATEAAARGVQASVVFEPVCGNGPPVAFDEDRPLPPGSVQKIVTSVAALDILGPDHRFVTRVWADGRIGDDGRLQGNLYLTGEGDPFLVTERLWLLAHDLAACGLRTVTGDLIVAAQAVADFDSIRIREATDSPYAAPVSRLAVNFNSLSFLVRPGSRPGLPGLVSIEPFPIPELTLENRVRTVTADQPNAVTAARRRSGPGSTWEIAGTIPAGAAPTWLYRSADDPAMLAGGVFAGLLAQNGVSIRAVRSGNPPQEATVLDSLPSLSLGSLMRSMNQWSNNFMADLLLLSLGGSASRAAGIERVRTWLRDEVGMDPLPRLADGCGLSNENRISAAQIVRLLRWASRRERTFPDLYASFPRPGGEGTMERRFRDAAPPSVRAKTGTLGDLGVSSIAGFIDAPDGGRWAFCILEQAPPGSGVGLGDLRLREERWLRLFAAP